MVKPRVESNPGLKWHYEAQFSASEKALVSIDTPINLDDVHYWILYDERVDGNWLIQLPKENTKKRTDDIAKCFLEEYVRIGKKAFDKCERHGGKVTFIEESVLRYHRDKLPISDEDRIYLRWPGSGSTMVPAFSVKKLKKTTMRK